MHVLHTSSSHDMLGQITCMRVERLNVSQQIEQDMIAFRESYNASRKKINFFLSNLDTARKRKILTKYVHILAFYIEMTSHAYRTNNQKKINNLRLSDGFSLHQIYSDVVWPLRNMALSNHDCIIIAENLPKHVNKLILADNNISDITPFRGRLSGIKELDLSNNDISDISALIDSIPGVTVLNLSHNNIHDIYPLTNSMQNIVELDLRSNRIRDIEALKGAISNVHTLHLSDNDICSIDPIVDSIATVQHLYLSYNNISDVAGFVDKLGIISHLYLNGNNIETVIALKDCVENLYCLNIEENYINHEFDAFNIPLLHH